MLATRTNNSFCGPAIAALAMVLVLTPQAANAQLRIQGTLSNFDVWNTCGATANDFHVILEGIRPDQLGDFYTGSYPNVEVIDTGSGSKIVWTGSQTPSGSFAHFGFTIDDDANPECFDFCWTRDGQILCCIPANAQDWRILTNGVQDIINSCGAGPRWIQRRVITQQDVVRLDDLLRDGRLWNEARIVDQVPVFLESGALVFDFDWNGDLSYVMMYDVFQDENGRPGNVIATFLNAAIVVPDIGFTIRLSGSCPGQKTLSWTGAGSGQMGILVANSTGTCVIPGGPCAGTQLGLSCSGLQLFNIIGTNGGSGQVSTTVGPAACGKFVQLIKTSNCATSNVAGPI